jgi:glycosyltransferase involved in cell wall biosynthesis
MTIIKNELEQTPTLVVVMPVYEDTEASTRLFREIGRLFGRNAYIVAVDDGSVMAPLSPSSITEAGVPGVVLTLRRNVGHQQAITVGLHYAAEQHTSVPRTVIMDSDGEDRPESIIELLRILDAGSADIVVAQRKSRQETAAFKTFYFFYKQIFKLLSGKKISFGNFMAMNSFALRRITAMQELWTHVAGCALSSRLRLHYLPLDRGARYAGSSKMSFVSLALHGFRGLMVFADNVMVRVGIFCTMLGILSILGGLTAIGLKISGFATPGWFSIALGILTLFFFQTGAITLMTLLLTGVAKTGGINLLDYRQYIEKVTHA